MARHQWRWWRHFRQLSAGTKKGSERTNEIKPQFECSEKVRKRCRFEKVLINARFFVHRRTERREFEIEDLKMSGLVRPAYQCFVTSTHPTKVEAMREALIGCFGLSFSGHLQAISV